ncbi:uncharacterized protein CLUP02_10087 [Colletotrichum lupini]|uniref:Uncharacterized protein n=1 Tax=Colletotrichum lupini TaxID=145971 RepID=A0A9Q8WJ77_9PEZI|nr:uncharacterized protein CLUP02_10087 [Colletotrichum lupini]UQC84590.1 hypothetical protein CLUP02_10087 [Colletotrichum lupini]
MYQYTPFSVSVSVYSPATLASSAAILTQALAVKDAKVWVENRDFFSEPWVVADSDSLGFLQSRGCPSKDLPRNVQEFRTPMNPTLRDLAQFGSGPTAAQDPDLNQCPNRAKGRRSRPGECHLTVELANGTIS